MDTEVEHGGNCKLLCLFLGCIRRGPGCCDANWGKGILVHVQNSGGSSCWLTGTLVWTKSWDFPKHFSTSPVGPGTQTGCELCSIPSHPRQNSCSIDPCMAQPCTFPNTVGPVLHWRDVNLTTCWFPQPLQGLASPLRAGKGCQVSSCPCDHWLPGLISDKPEQLALFYTEEALALVDGND